MAVLSVLVYHLRSDWLPGGFIGVDIFFVISGFLITSHLVREHEKTGRISLARFYARRMVRLIPAATVVLLGTAVATVIFIPRILWRQIGTDLIAAATYVINWLLASRSVDYLAEDSIVSPLQHFWSLAVEEQYYLIWPLLVIIAGAIAAQRRLPKRRVMAVGAVAVVVLSLAAAIFAEIQQDVTAYFSTFTRLWELAAGALAALAIARLQRTVPGRWLKLLFWVGLLVVIGSVVLMALPRFWPGTLTIIPVVGTALVLLTGGTGFKSVAERTLSLKPLTWVGGISYSLYLWHWPIIVIAGYVFATIGLLHAAIILVLSVLLAWLSSILVENPIRFSGWATRRPRNGLLLGLVSAFISVAAGLGLMLSGPSNVLQAPDGAKAAGAASLASPVTDTPAAALAANPDWTLPSALEATADVPVLYADGCQQDESGTDVKVCTYGDVDSSRVMALVGDSKAAQWEPALDAIAKQESMRLVVMTKSACAFSAAPSSRDGARYTSCDAWNENALTELATLRPELVLTSQVQGFAWTGTEPARTAESRQTMADGIRDRVSQLAASGVHVGIIADTPQTPGAVYDCVAENPDDVSVCGYPLADGIKDSALPTQLAAAQELGAPVLTSSSSTPSAAAPVTVLDMTDYICPPQVADNCPPVIGESLIYRQGSHVTATYVATMENPLHDMLRSAGLLAAP